MPAVTTTYDTSTVTYDQSSLSYDGYPAPLANMPAVGVFIAWSDGPYVAAPAWTEVSQYVRAVDIRRGRGDDLQQFPPGGASVTLDNRDRLFDPFNNSGANYANLKPRRQIKIVANWAGVEYPLFRGFIAGWPVEYTEGGLDSTVTIDCFDALGLMANEQVPADWPDFYTRSLSPQHYWKFNDSMATSTVVDNNAAGETNLNMTVSSGGTIYENPPMADGCVSSSLYCEAVNSPAGVVGLDTTQPDLTLVGLFSNPNAAGSNSMQAEWYTRNCYLALIWSPTTGTFYIEGANSTNSRRSLFTAPFRSQPIHVAAVMNANAGGNPILTVYINGQAATPTSSTTSSGFPVGNERFAVTRGTFQEVAGWTTALTAANVTLLYGAVTGRITESTTARMGRLIDTTSWPAALEDFTTSPVANVAQLGNSAGVVPELQTVSQSEGGELYVTNAGVLKFVNRNNWSSATRSNTSQMTFTDTGTGVDYDAGSVRMAFDADRIRNDINVRFSGGGIVNDTDTTSIATNGAAEWSVNTVLDSPTSAATLADRLVQLYKDPKLRLEPFMAKGQQDATYNWPRLLALELLDRVTFKRTPATGSAVQRDLLVQSIEHRITPGTWETVVNGSTRYTGWFILGVSLLGSSEDVLL